MNGEQIDSNKPMGPDTVSLREYLSALMIERDRRYSEVAMEREKALKIKEEADKAALGLAREIQTYKDEKANELRSQIERERGSYATQNDLKATVEKVEAAMKPLAEYVSRQAGRGAGLNAGWLYLLGAIAAIGTIMSMVLLVKG